MQAYGHGILKPRRIVAGQTTAQIRKRRAAERPPGPIKSGRTVPVPGFDAPTTRRRAHLARSCPMALRQFSMWQVSAVPDGLKALAGTQHPKRLRTWHKLLIQKGKRWRPRAG